MYVCLHIKIHFTARSGGRNDNPVRWAVWLLFPACWSARKPFPVSTLRSEQGCLHHRDENLPPRVPRTKSASFRSGHPKASGAGGGEERLVSHHPVSYTHLRAHE